MSQEGAEDSLDLGFGQGLTDLVSDSFDSDENLHIKSFRVQVSLGSSIQSTKITENGFSVTYSHGDECAGTGSEHHASRIDFECYLKGTGNDDPEEKPYLQDFDADRCFYQFKWKTRYACPQCREGDVEVTEGQCEELELDRPTLAPPSGKGVRKYWNTPKKGERCVIVPKQDVLDDNTRL